MLIRLKLNSVFNLSLFVFIVLMSQMIHPYVLRNKMFRIFEKDLL